MSAPQDAPMIASGGVYAEILHTFKVGIAFSCKHFTQQSASEAFLSRPLLDGEETVIRFETALAAKFREILDAPA